MRTITTIIFVLLSACYSSPSHQEYGDMKITDLTNNYDLSLHDLSLPKDLSPQYDLSLPDKDYFNTWPASTTPIVYNGGPVMLGVPNVYFIFYGNFTNETTQPILEDLIQNFKDTPYNEVLSSFYQESQPGSEKRQYVSGNVNFVKSIHNNYRYGKQLYVEYVEWVIIDALKDGTLPYDNNGIYVVLTSSDVVQPGGFFGGFCGAYCGWHTSDNINGYTIKYAFIGDPEHCLYGCSIKDDLDKIGITHTPNNNWSADSMASVLIHEVSEILTDPLTDDNPGWMDVDGRENADKCAWRFEPVYKTDNGAIANIKFGDRDYLIQQTWIPDNHNGHCGIGF